MYSQYSHRKHPDSGKGALNEGKGATQRFDLNYQPTQADMGSRTDLPEAMRAKMEAAFGMDFSGVQIYQSQTVADAGANAVTMGNKIAFAPGKLDLTSRSGQTLLGHELSHVASQARGEVTGQGFLNDSLLEARADREGAMAAAGESIYSGAVSPLSGSNIMSMVGPMQADKPEPVSEEDQKDYEQHMEARPKSDSSAPEIDHIPTKLRETGENGEIVESEKSYADRHRKKRLYNREGEWDRIQSADKKMGIRAALGQIFRRRGYRKSVDMRGWVETRNDREDLNYLSTREPLIEDETEELF